MRQKQLSIAVGSQTIRTVWFRMKRKRLQHNSPWTSEMTEKGVEGMTWDIFRIMVALVHLPCNQKRRTCDMVAVVHLPTKVTSPLWLLIQSTNSSYSHTCIWLLCWPTVLLIERQMPIRIGPAWTKHVNHQI